jgi:hypothetical protein
MTVTAPVRTPFDATTTAAEVVEGIDLSGRCVIVTGVASGIGIETAPHSTRSKTQTDHHCNPDQEERQAPWST